ncbi:MAG TPA: tetratricopeptide repeat protein [Pyrinomonadaceae bacterium]
MKFIFITVALASLILIQANCGSKNTQTAAAVNSANTTEAAEQVVDPGARSEAQKLLEQGNELARQDKDAEAAEVYQRAVSLDPDLAEAHLRLAMTYLVLEKKDEAEAEYKKAAEAYQKYVRQNPKDAKAYFDMGLAYSKIGKPAEAVKALQQAARLEPENSDYQYELGIAYSKVSQYQESVNALQKALDLNPDNYRAQEAFEKAKVDLQRWQSMVKQQEAMARRQANKNANVNANTSSSPTPEVH